jgi:hypothetical protein
MRTILYQGLRHPVFCRHTDSQTRAYTFLDLGEAFLASPVTEQCDLKKYVSRETSNVGAPTIKRQNEELYAQ